MERERKRQFEEKQLIRKGARRERQEPMGKGEQQFKGQQTKCKTSPTTCTYVGAKLAAGRHVAGTGGELLNTTWGTRGHRSEDLSQEGLRTWNQRVGLDRPQDHE